MTPPPPPDRRAIGVIGAYVEGWRRVLKAPAVWAASLVVTLPLLIALFNPPDSVAVYSTDIAHDTNAAIRSQSFSLQAEGPLTVVVQGLGNGVPPVVMTLLIAIFCFLWGGFLDRLARARPVGAGPFFAACGVYFWRFLRLLVPVGLAYWALWRLALNVHPAVTILGLAVVNIVCDYAVVRTVVEDRLSMLGALVAAVRFIRRRPLSVVALYAFGIAARLAIRMLWNLVDYGALGHAAIALLVVLQIEVLLLLWSWLALAAAEIVFFQHALAHAEYTAAPLPIWPDSPAAEAIENLTRVGPKPS